MNTLFRLDRETKNAKADATKTLASFMHDSNTRYAFTDTEDGIADTIRKAMEVSGKYGCLRVSAEFVKLPFAKHFGTELFQFVAKHMDVYDVLRKYDDPDANTKEVKNGHVYTTSAKAYAEDARVFHVQRIAEHWKTQKNGTCKLRGIRFRVWYTDPKAEEPEAETDLHTLDFAVDTRGRIAAKQYGIGAMFTLAKPEIDAYATALANDARVRTHMYTRVNIVLNRIASGNSVQRTDKGTGK